MIDPWAIKILEPLLRTGAGILKKKGFRPDQVTLAGFALGLIACFAIWANLYIPALCFILLNRVMDGLDGALARLTIKTDAGGFLDVCLDFIFYSAVVTGFALADPQNNAIAALVLMLGFVGTGTSFLAFAAMAEKHGLDNTAYPHKALYYTGGLTEGFETIIFFILICIFPQSFSFFAFLFAFLCLVTTITRITSGYVRLKQVAENKEKMALNSKKVKKFRNPSC